MPKLSRSTSNVDASQPFGVYDGPVPPRGNYPAVVQNVTLSTSNAGNLKFDVLATLLAPEDSPKAVYNGYPVWTTITLTDIEANLRREQAFYIAITGKKDVDIVTDPENERGRSKVTSISGKNPVGVAIRVDLREDNRADHKGEMQGDTIYAASAAEKLAAREAQNPATSGDPDAPTTVEAEKPATKSRTRGPLAAVPDPAPDTEEKSDDYGSMTLPQLRAAAKEKGVDTKGLSKAALIEALQGEGEGDEDESAVFASDKLTKMSQPGFAAYLKNHEYDPADFEGLSRAEAIEVLVEDGTALPF